MGHDKVRAGAIGGPGHGRTFAEYPDKTLNMAPMRLVPGVGQVGQWDWKRRPDDTIIPESYRLERILAPGWRVRVPVWVHLSLQHEGGPLVPLRLLPEIMRGYTYPACAVAAGPLWAVRRRAAS